jgi:hypothetical protein
MKPAAVQGRRAQGYLLGALFASGLFALVLAACGISLSAEEDGTEIFRHLTVEGDFRPAAALSLTLEYSRQYEVAVDVECYLRDLDTSTPTPVSTATTIPVPGMTPAPGQVSIFRPRPTPGNRVLLILSESLPPNPEGGPVGEATPVPGTITRRFFVPERPGRYSVRCFTPADDNNSISENITIAPLPTLTP